MTGTVPDILNRIVERKKAELAEAVISRSELEQRASQNAAWRRDFSRALRARTPSIIAEIKKASPSRGVLVKNFDPSAIASAYEAGGAAALSVLTDRNFFQGSFADLQAARQRTGIPVLRKDFTIDPFHVIEAAAYGADAILLIAAILSEGEMRKLRELATAYRLSALVEVHDESELKSAIASGAEIIGVNNRNLHTFEVRFETSLRLAEQIPSGVIRVAESGITSREDVRRLVDCGYHAFLVGEHLMRSGNPRQAVQELLG